MGCGDRIAWSTRLGGLDGGRLDRVGEPAMLRVVVAHDPPNRTRPVGRQGEIRTATRSSAATASLLRSAAGCKVSTHSFRRDPPPPAGGLLTTGMSSDASVPTSAMPARTMTALRAEGDAAVESVAQCERVTVGDCVQCEPHDTVLVE